MAVMKKGTRKKLTKQLNKLIKRHGAEMALALVTGIVSALGAERADKVEKKARRLKVEGPPKVRPVRVVKVVKAEMPEAPDPVDQPEKPLKADRIEKAAARRAVVKRRL